MYEQNWYCKMPIVNPASLIVSALDNDFANAESPLIVMAANGFANLDVLVDGTPNNATDDLLWQLLVSMDNVLFSTESIDAGTIPNQNAQIIQPITIRDVPWRFAKLQFASAGAATTWNINVQYQLVKVTEREPIFVVTKSSGG